MDNLIKMLNISTDMQKIIYTIKILFINICTYYTFYKATNTKGNSIKKTGVTFVFIVIVSIICSEIKYSLDYLSSILCLILLMSTIYTIINKNEFIYNMVGIIICLAINYVIFFIAILLNFIPNILILDANNDWLNLLIMMIIHSILLYRLFKIKRLKNGIDFLKLGNKNDYFNILMLNISITIIFSFIIIKNIDKLLKSNMMLQLIILSIIIFITIQKTLTMYYKHKMLIKDLNETKEELERMKKDRDKIEQENIEISKASHSISHKIKSLSRKVDKLMMNNEVANEIDIRNRINEISKEYYKDNVIVELSKTDIEIIDDMLDSMKQECIENNIDIQLQLSGNIHYMVNNIVSKEELEILLADHITDAIIAIKHSDNMNRSILVRLGFIEECYSLYIYDTGIEFDIDTLVNLGTKPITTHNDDGGTGMGFMNTFDTLKKHKASMIINEIGKPCGDNFTKVIMIKFDDRNEFRLESYRSKEFNGLSINNTLKLT